MDPLDPASQLINIHGIKPLITLAIFSTFGSFFLGALITSIKRGMKENGWFKLKDKQD